jgi:uncharacterized protein YciI
MVGMKTQFFVKLIPPRPTFAQEMSGEEAVAMREHIEYWTGLMKQGKVHVFGPVQDPEGAYGIGVISAESEKDVREMTRSDPAARIMMIYRIYPMRAMLPS